MSLAAYYLDLARRTRPKSFKYQSKRKRYLDKAMKHLARAIRYNHGPLESQENRS